MPSLCRRAVVLVTLASLSALGGPPDADLKYGAGPLEPKTLTKLSDAELVKKLVTYVKFYKLTEVVKVGADKPAWSAADPSTDSFASLSRGERLGLLCALQRKPQYLELDMLLDDGTGLVPVTVTWDEPLKVTLESGPAVKTLLPEGITAEQLQKKYGVGEFKEGDAKWDPRAYAAVDQALALLSPKELEQFKGVPFFRAQKNGIERAAYTRGNNEPRVEVYDATFMFDDESFMGTPNKPVADSVGVLLHELGHGLADTRMREKSLKGRAAVAAAKAAKDGNAPDAAEKVKVANDFTNGLNAIDSSNKGRGRPAERAFAAVSPPAKSVSVYGRKNPTENLAECFRLFRADPAALARISPAALEWFKADKLLDEALKPIE